MSYWQKAKTWTVEGLRSQADDLSTKADSLSQCSQDVLGLRMPAWVSTAADLAKVDRELLADRAAQIGEMFIQLADVQRQGADGLAQIKADQQATEQALDEIGLRVNSMGMVMRKENIPVISIPSWSREAYGMVSAISKRLWSLDLACASGVREVKSDARREQRRHRMLDRMNAQRLHSIPGALDGVEWLDNLQDGLLRVIPFPGNGLLWDARTKGTVPRWYQDYLLHGTLPSATELVANGLLNRLNRFDRGPGNFLEDGVARVPWQKGDAFHDPQAIGNIGWLYNRALELGWQSHEGGHESSTIQVRLSGDKNNPTAVVILPSTHGGFDGGANANDWTSNAQAKGYGTTALSQSAIAAIDEAMRAYNDGKPPSGKPNVMLTGYSQGGLQAANVAADPSFAARYNVTDVVAYGAPIHDVEVGPNTQVTNIANEHDGVARTTRGHHQHANFHEIKFDGRVNEGAVGRVREPWDAHMASPYHKNIDEAIQQSGHKNHAEVTALNNRLQPYFQEGATVYNYNTGRVTRD